MWFRRFARREWPHWLILGAMFVASAVAWPLIDAPIPIHWNARLEVDGYGGRFEGLLLIPLIAVGLYLLLAVLPRIDPARANYASFAGSYSLVRMAMLLFLGVMHAAIIAGGLGSPIDAGAVIPSAVGLLFILLGAVMGKIRPNYFAGVRTPWTLASAKSWTLTHRLAGRVFVAYGVLIIAMGFVRQPWFVGLGLAAVFAGLVWMIVYSYVVWRGDTDRVPVTGTLPAPDEG
jgi:uncharacterized membrane protein